LPTYEYHCDGCDKNFDVVQSFHDDPLTACPTCGAPVRKVFGNVGIVFKGSGFYKTDSRNGTSAKKSEAGESSPGSDAGSKTSEPADNGKSSADSGGSPPAPSTSTPTTSDKSSTSNKKESPSAGAAPTPG
jgi:putative FmdB family regulatory protein